MALPIPYHSAAMVRALPDIGVRYETVHGELLVTPAPRLAHQAVLRNLFAALYDYLRAHGLADTLFFSPADISWGEDILVQPDLFVTAADEVGGEWRGVRTLYLVIEILSPATARADRFTKRRLYQEYGVVTYWVVDLEERLVEVWTPEALFPVVEREAIRWRHPASDQEVVIDWDRMLDRSGRPETGE